MSIAIGLLACCTKDYYIGQLHACVETWCDNDFTYFLSGEQCGNRCKEKNLNVLHFPGVSDDVFSATRKQWEGLRFLYENFPEKDYFYLAGTDTYARLD